MVVTGIRKATASQNGVSSFILQCRRMDFHYCDYWGSSKGMNSFLRNTLSRFAAANPAIEICVSPRPSKHPVIIGHYLGNGTNRQKAICVRNLEKEQILQKAELLRDASGEKLKRVKKPVTSIKDSVRGIWSPYHGGGTHV
ncbi:hypothetical protein WAI453_008521 [Rhynchosporium graminicola]|uniref:Large ribosomal subunit protein mL43 n=1 Tax=Rhynchosporium graminicola TaxID=2792576 RepID=A0A1E1KH14_9HELO|nr:probable mitochondrial ribosomal protein, large subunit [Rhynchosporium commune]